MNKNLRIFVALAVLAVVIAVSLNGTAWAGKLNASSQSPVAGLPAPRAEGTGHTTDPVGSSTGGAPILVGSVASIQPNTGCTVYAVLFKDTLPSGYPAETTYPGKMSNGSVIQLSCQGNNFCGAMVCYNVGPDSKEAPYYWDGSAWQKTAIEVKDGLACIYVPPSAPSPTFTTLFTPK